MPNKTEIIYFAIIVLFLGFIISLSGAGCDLVDVECILSSFTWLNWLAMAGLALIMLLIHVTSQKLVASKLNCDIEFRPWTIQRYGFKPRAYFKKPFPAWLILPLTLVFLTTGYIKWFALTVFDASARKGRIGKYTKLTEWELALIAAAGPLANLALAIISQFIGWYDFALLNAAFALFYLIPLGDLDGAKIFFGGKIFWMFIAVFALVIYILLGITNIATTVVAALVLAFIVVLFYYYLFESKIAYKA